MRSAHPSLGPHAAVHPRVVRRVHVPTILPRRPATRAGSRRWRDAPRRISFHGRWSRR